MIEGGERRGGGVIAGPANFVQRRLDGMSRRTAVGIAVFACLGLIPGTVAFGAWAFKKGGSNFIEANNDGLDEVSDATSFNIPIPGRSDDAQSDSLTPIVPGDITTSDEISSALAGTTFEQGDAAGAAAPELAVSPNAYVVPGDIGVWTLIRQRCGVNEPGDIAKVIDASGYTNETEFTAGQTVQLDCAAGN